MKEKLNKLFCLLAAFIAIVLVVGIAASCDDDEEEENNPTDEFFNLDCKSMTFPGEGGTKMALIAGSYQNYKCETQDSWIDCSISTSTSQLIVTVEANDTGKERQGQITVMATTPMGNTLKKLVLPITQEILEDDSQPLVATPSWIGFTNVASDDTIFVNHSPAYSYTAYTYNSDMKEWANVKLVGEDKTSFVLAVEVVANTTEKPRSGNIIIFAARDNTSLQNALSGKVDATKVQTTVVTVEQEEEKIWENEIKELTAYVELASLRNGKIEEQWHQSHTFERSENQIKTIRKDKSLHVECLGILTTTNSIYTGSLTFDIDDITEDAIIGRTAKIINVKYQFTDEPTEAGRQEYYYSIKKEYLEIPSIPMKGGGRQWSGKRSEGIEFNNFMSQIDSYKRDGTLDETWFYTLTNSPDDFVSIIIDFGEYPN